MPTDDKLEQSNKVSSSTPSTTSSGSLLDDLLENARIEKSDAETYPVARRGLEALIEGLVRSPSKYPKIDREAVDAMIAEIDKRLEDQVNEILHAPAFQKLESTWKSTKYLVDHCDLRDNIRVTLLHATKQDLADDFEDSAEIVRSGYYRLLYSKEYGTFGGEPYGAIVTDFDFTGSGEDVRLYTQLAAVSAMAHAPLLSNASPKMFGGETFEELTKMKDLQAHFDSPQYTRWRSFRTNEDTKYVGLAVPRFLLRAPYAPGENTVREFSFTEDVRSNHDHYLWGPASFALAARCADAFSSYGWCSNIIGPTGGGAVDDLPLHQFEAMGELQTKVPVEVQLTERREYELSEEGFIGLVYRRGSDNAAFFSANSVLRAKTFEDSDKESELNYRLGTQLPYMFLVSRVAHYLKIQQREMIGTYTSKERIEYRLKWWLSNYTTKKIMSQKMMARYPFKESSVRVEDVPGVAGWYRIKVQLVPHFKYMGADFTLSLVGKLDKSLSENE